MRLKILLLTIFILLQIPFTIGVTIITPSEWIQGKTESINIQTVAKLTNISIQIKDINGNSVHIEEDINKVSPTNWVYKFNVPSNLEPGKAFILIEMRDELYNNFKEDIVVEVKEMTFIDKLLLRIRTWIDFKTIKTYISTFTKSLYIS